MTWMNCRQLYIRLSNFCHNGNSSIKGDQQAARETNKDFAASEASKDGDESNYSVELRSFYFLPQMKVRGRKRYRCEARRDP